MKAILFIACLLVFSINLLNAQGLEITNKPTTENTLMEDVGFWDAYGKSFVETLLILVVIFIGFSKLYYSPSG